MQTTRHRLRSVVEESLRRGRPATAPLVLVDAAHQRLMVWDVDRVVDRQPVSTARAGLGEQRDSGRTPRGFHEIRERIGGGAPPGQVFVDRLATPEVLPPDQWRQPGTRDAVLTRILWLAGLEPGRNQGGAVDSHARYIYLHGTNHEHRLGTAASAGCVRLSNRAILRLYDALEGRVAWCWIGERLDDD